MREVRGGNTIKPAQNSSIDKDGTPERISHTEYGEKYLSERQTARELGISRITLFRLRRAGRIASYKIGSRVVYSRAQIQRFLAECEQPASQKGTVQDVA